MKTLVTKIEQFTHIKQSDVEFPSNYQKMVAAIDEVIRIDLCAELSNRAAALASYYKQSNDLEQEHKFHRIRLRARLRCREILDSMQSQEQCDSIKYIGMRNREYAQLGDALKIERPQRDQLIDAKPPATLQSLAKIGSPPPIYVPQPGTGSAPGFSGVLAFWKVCASFEANIEARKIDSADVAYLRQLLIDIEEWTGEFERHLPKLRALTRE